MRILVTAGPTREYLDSVRFLSNASSGRMGYAIAECARARGHEVVLISGPVALTPPPEVRVVAVETAEQMLQAALAQFDACAAAVMTAAVADFRPVTRPTHKVPKPPGVWQLPLERTPDICAALGARKGHRVVIAFAVQDEDAQARAAAKLARKDADAIVLNGPETLGSLRARQQVLVRGEAWREPYDATKPEAAERVVSLVEELVSHARFSRGELPA